ncbi:beta strand repeat-containing protein [Halarchaeum sp. P4]|uniref:beta strand repeat-containing protein n=1 Tax=Halarchaeum sp. P4 TaxID=3421639 RepID=UPI003EC0A63C
MTRNTKSLALSALLVVSVFATAGVGFVGTAAATQSATITATPSNATATATHHVTAVPDSNEVGSSLSAVKVTYEASDSGNVSGIEDAYIVRDSNRTNITDDFQAVTHSNNGKTVTFDFGGSYDLEQGDTIHVVYDDVRNPSSAGTYAVEVDLNPQSSGAPANATLNVTSAPLNSSLSASPNWDGVNATHTLDFVPSSAQDNQTLRNLSVDYGSNGTLYPVNASNVTAFADADNDGTYDSGETSLNVTNVTTQSGTVTLAFNGSYTLNDSVPVVARYGPVGNPASAGTYTASVVANGDAANATQVSFDIVASSTTSNASVVPNPPYTGATSVHTATGTVGSNDASDSLNSFRIDYHENEDATDVSNVGLSDVRRVGIDTNSDGEIDTNVSDDLSSVSISNNGHTLVLQFGGDYTLSQGDRVIAAYGDVQNPTSTGTYTTAVGINVQSGDADTAVQFDITNRPANATLNATPASDGANATHRLAFQPGTVQCGVSVTSLAANYSASAATVGVGNATLSTAFIDADGDRTYDNSETRLNASGFTAANGTVEATFPGAHNVSCDERVVLVYDNVTNPESGTYGVPTALNGDWANGTDATLAIHADTAVTNATLNASPPYPDATSTHTATVEVAPNDDSDSLNSIRVDYAANETATDISNVGQGDVVAVGIDTNGDGEIDTNVSDDLGEVDGSNDGHTLTFGFGGSYSLQQGDTVIVTYQDVQNPSTTGTYHATVDVNVQSTASAVPASYEVNARESTGGTNIGDDGGNTGGGSWSGDTGGTDSTNDGTNDGTDTTTTTTTTTTQTTSVTSTTNTADGGETSTTTSEQDATAPTTTSSDDGGIGLLPTSPGAAAIALVLAGSAVVGGGWVLRERL